MAIGSPVKQAARVLLDLERRNRPPVSRPGEPHQVVAVRGGCGRGVPPHQAGPRTQDIRGLRGVLLGSERGTKRPLGTPLAAYFQNRRVHTLTRDDVAGWFAQRVRGGAQDTKHRVSKNSRAFLRFCREQGYTEQDLAGSIDPFRAGRGRVEWLEWDDVHRLIDAIPEHRLKMAAA